MSMKTIVMAVLASQTAHGFGGSSQVTSPGDGDGDATSLRSGIYGVSNTLSYQFKQNAACEGNSQGIVRLSGVDGISFDQCTQRCDNTNGCEAIDYFTQTGWCNTFAVSCDNPWMVKDGATHYIRVAYVGNAGGGQACYVNQGATTPHMNSYTSRSGRSCTCVDGTWTDCQTWGDVCSNQYSCGACAYVGGCSWATLKSTGQNYCTSHSQDPDFSYNLFIVPERQCT